VQVVSSKNSKALIGKGAGGQVFRPRVGGWLDEFDRKLDYVYAVISASRAVGLASVTKSVRWNSAAFLVTPLKIALVIDFHAVFFYELAHPMQHMSAWGFAAAAFSSWILFGDGFGKAIPQDISVQSFKQRKIPLPTFFFFNFLFYTTICAIGVILSYLILIFIGVFFNTGAFFGSGVSINVPFYLMILALSYFFGFGVGFFIKKLAIYVKAFNLVFYFGAPFLFLLSGVFNSYIYVPTFIQKVMLWSPMLPVIEFARVAFDPGYFASESTLWYPFCLSFVFLFVAMLMDHAIPAKTHRKGDDGDSIH
jgi:hypothetical protein